MKHIATLAAPLLVYLPRKTMDDKTWILNLNNYRNAPHFLLNDTKKLYKQVMAEQIAKLPQLGRIAVRFRLFPKTRRKTDTPNVCSIHDKYFMDALVEANKLQDDHYDFYVETGYVFGEVDKHNPRVEIEIFEVEHQ